MFIFVMQKTVALTSHKHDNSRSERSDIKHTGEQGLFTALQSLTAELSVSVNHFSLKSRKSFLKTNYMLKVY